MPDVQIFHVDDSEEWRNNVLFWLSGLGTLFPFNSLDDFEKAVRLLRPQLVICDGSVDRTNDGLDISVQLAREGFKVILLTSDMLAKQELRLISQNFKFEVVTKGRADISRGAVLRAAVVELLNRN